MKSSKKLLVALLVFTMLLSTLSVGFAAEAKTEAAAVTRAKALGILKGDQAGNLNLDKPITRAEALTLIVRISGLESSADLMKGMTQFADVTAAHWASGYVNLGVGQKIVNGYPDGSFKPEGQVTYAEMVKMLLYAMNYGVTVEGAAWPAGVMGKADQLDLFDKVNAAPNVPALRGDVVQMIDNSLTVKHLVQTGYGDLKQYEEGKDSFLSKLKVKELEDVVVTEIAKATSKLDDDEIRLVGKDVDDVYTLKADVSAEAIFGLKVNVWVNDDDEIFFVKVKTADKDILFDTVAVNATKDEVELKVEDDEFDWADDAKIYVNFAKVKPAEVKKDAYGKFVLEKGEVVFANLFSFDLINAGVVTELKNDRVYYNIGESEKSIRLEDYKDGVYVYDSEFQAIELEDIEEDNLIYAWADGKEIYIIVVAGEPVEGKLERVRDKEIKVDGKAYDVASNATASNNDDKDIEIYTVGGTDSSAAEDLAGNNVEVLLDINGEVRHIRGDAKATSGDMYGIVMDAYRDGGKYTLTIFNHEGKKVGIEVDDRDVWDGYADVHLDYKPVKYNVNKDNVIKEADDIKEVTDSITVDEFDKDKNYIKATNGKNYFIEDSTVMMKYDGTNDKQALVKWDDIKGKSASGAKAYIVGDAGKTAKFVVFYDKFDDIVEEDLYGIVATNPEYDGDDWIVEIDVSGEGKKDYIVPKSNTVAKGQVITFTVDSSNEIKSSNITVADAVYTVKDVSGRYVEFKEASDSYRLDSDTVAYKNKKSGLDKKIDIADIDEGDQVYVILKDSFVKAILVLYEAPKEGPGAGDDSKVDAVNGASTAAEMRKALEDLGVEEYNKKGIIDRNDIAKKLLDLEIEFDTQADIIEVLEELMK